MNSCMVRFILAHTERAFFSTPNCIRHKDYANEHIREWTRGSLRRFLRRYWRHVGVRAIVGTLFAEVDDAT